MGNFALYEAQWPGVRDLCSRPYWKRIWIVQEVGVARNIQIVCGKDQLSWNDFSQLFLKISTSKAIAVAEAVQSIKSSLASRLQTQRTAYQSHGCTLWRLLRDFADSLCAVPHDKVYGLLGLASGGMSELIVDYSKSLTELQRDLVALYNEDLRGESSNTAEVNPKMPNIVLFASFLSRSLGIYTEDMATFDFNPVFLPPAQTLLQVEATLVGVITALHSKKPYGPPSSALHFKGSWKEPGLQDDAYLGKFSFEEERSRYFVRGVVAAQRGMPLRHNEEPYIQAHERHSRHPASKTVPRDTQTQFHILHEVRWLSATNNVRGFGPDGIQAGD